MIIIEKAEIAEIKIKELQKYFKKYVIPLLDEVYFLQRTLDINLGLQIDEKDDYAPRRYFIKDEKDNRINFHPSFGVKRYAGNRCGGKLKILMECFIQTEIFLNSVCKKLEKSNIPKIKDIERKCPLIVGLKEITDRKGL